ncbi:hypothetical protein OB934_07425 [Aeromonas salmonicida]|uniref:hypothetical protein n=1 Tax=Aeromonas salmonicida TaxID=645 RepID=UPI00259E3B30|nr:hypothetical protein [Aeromonas salmonicida]MDM5062625.1 hypothetical protein [Aeromonas salmonicida]
MKAIDTLNIQGKSGAFTLPGLAKEGPKIFAAYAATGRKGAEAVNELGAALQVFKGSIGTEAETVTAFEAVIRDLTNPQTVRKLAQLSKGKISVFDPKELKNGKEVMQSLPELMSQIVIQSKGLSKNLDALNLSQEAKRAFNPLITEYMNTGDVKAFEEFMNMQGDGSTTLADAAVAASDFAASLQLVSNSWSQFSNQQLAGPVADLANAINSLEPDAVQNWLETGKNIALVVGGLVAVKKGVDAVRWTKGVWDAAKPSKSGAGGMGGAMADLGATPVYVVNMPGGGIGGPDLGGGGQGKPSTKPSRFSPAGLVQFGTVAAGISMIPYFSPINISRANGMSANGIPQAPGILDVFDEMKAFFTRDISASPRPDNLSSTIDINVRDDRITVRARDAAPGLQVRVDNGPSLMP